MATQVVLCACAGAILGVVKLGCDRIKSDNRNEVLRGIQVQENSVMYLHLFMPITENIMQEIASLCCKLNQTQQLQQAQKVLKLFNRICKNAHSLSSRRHEAHNAARLHVLSRRSSIEALNLLQSVVSYLCTYNASSHYSCSLAQWKQLIEKDTDRILQFIQTKACV